MLVEAATQIVVFRTDSAPFNKDKLSPWLRWTFHQS